MKPATFQIMQPDGSLRCVCGGTQFNPQRSAGRKVAFGFASLLGSTNEVKCLACGRKYAVEQFVPTAAVPAPRTRMGKIVVPPRPDL